MSSPTASCQFQAACRRLTDQAEETENRAEDLMRQLCYRGKGSYFDDEDLDEECRVGRVRNGRRRARNTD